MSDSPIVTPTTPLTTPQPVDDLVNKVASLVGQPDDPDARALAIAALDEAAGHINLQGTYIMNFRETELTLTDGSTSFPLPDDFAWPFGLARFYNPNDTSNFRVKQFVTWVPWEAFNISQQNRMLVNELPQLLSLKGDGSADRTAYFFPAANAYAASLTLAIPYLTRVSRLTESANIVMNDETRTVLLTGGKALFAMHRYLATPQIWQPLWTIFQDQLVKIRGAGDRIQALDTWNSFSLDEPLNWFPRSYIKFGNP